MNLRYRYQTVELRGLDVHVRSLRDTQQFSDDQGAAADLGIGSAVWPLFGIVWDSGVVLADLMIDFPVDELRVLEVGCGLGLASLVLHTRDADITATDRHPSAAAFLDENIRINGGGELPFTRTDWKAEADTLGRFDLIIGSDLLYERDHAELLAEFVEAHAESRCTVILVDPSRGNQGPFIKRMAALGFTHGREHPGRVQGLDGPYKGSVHTFERRARS